MPEFVLRIDQTGADMLAFQKYNKTLCRGYYLLRDNPAVRLVTRGGFIEDCVSYVLPVLAGFEECWGQWPANAHLKGRKAFVVTLFAGEVRRAPDARAFSDWLRDNYLRTGAPFEQAGGVYHTKTHPRRGKIKLQAANPGPDGKLQSEKARKRRGDNRQERHDE